MEDPISIAQLSESISPKESWVVVFLTPRQQSLRADQENRIIIGNDPTYNEIVFHEHETLKLDKPHDDALVIQLRLR